MIYRIEDILRDVRVCIDHNDISEPLFQESDPDTLELDGIIASCVETAAEAVEKAAPVHLLEQGHRFGHAVYWKELQSGYVLLPDDFMRLVAFRMSDWEKTCFTAMSAEDPEYRHRSSRFKGLRGNPQKPVCAIVPHPEGLALEFYSCKTEDAFVSVASYIPLPRLDAGGGIDISRKCYRPVVYETASLVLTTCGEEQRAVALSTLAKSFLQ